MTVNTTSIFDGPYAGNDIADAFAYNFAIDEDTEITVYETDNLGVTSELVLTTHYTVSGAGDPAGGDVTRVAGPLPTGYTWNIRANYAPTQLTAFASQGGFFPHIHEYGFDKLSYLIQQHEDLIGRAIAAPPYEPALDMTLPVVADRLGNTLVFNAVTGKPEAGPSVGAISGAAAAAAAALVSENNAAASEAAAGVSEVNAAASEAAAAASAASLNIPDPISALYMLRVNAAATAYELRTPVQVLADIGAANLAGSASQAFEGSTLKAATTIGVGAATPAATGAGITFPATQSASSDANTLDDYEEGTWSPALKFNGTSVGMTYTEQIGTYIKIGSMVYCNMLVLLSAKGSSTGTASIDGLPFANSSVVKSLASPFVTGLVTSTSVGLQINPSNTTMILHNAQWNYSSSLLDSNLSNTSAIRLEFSYSI